MSEKRKTVEKLFREGIKRLRTNYKMYYKTALWKSSFIRWVAAIAGCKGSLQYVGGRKMEVTRPPPLSGYLSEICLWAQENMS